MLIEFAHEEDDIEEQRATDDIVSKNVDVEQSTFGNCQIRDGIDDNNTTGREEEHSSTTFLRKVELEGEVSHI
jgi:hypothetical protein